MRVTLEKVKYVSSTSYICLSVECEDREEILFVKVSSPMGGSMISMSGMF